MLITSSRYSNLYIDNDSTNYAMTMLAVQNIIDSEMPDLVVLTGDTVAPSMEESFTNRFEEAIQYLEIV